MFFYFQTPSEGEKEETQSNKDLDLGFPEDDEDGGPEGIIGNVHFAGGKIHFLTSLSFSYSVV